VAEVGEMHNNTESQCGGEWREWIWDMHCAVVCMVLSLHILHAHLINNRHTNSRDSEFAGCRPSTQRKARNN